MSTTLLQMRTLVLNLINEDSDSDVGQVSSANAASPTQTTAQTLTDLINKGYSLLAKTCVALLDTGTLAYPENAFQVQDSAFTMTSGGTLFAPIEVAWNGTELSKQDMAYADLNSSVLGQTSGVPLYWTPYGTYAVGISPPPATAETATVFGAVTAPVLVNDGDDLFGIPDTDVIYIAYWVAYIIASKNSEDPALLGKIQPWLSAFQEAQYRMWNQLRLSNPALCQKYFPQPVQQADPSQQAQQ